MSDILFSPQKLTNGVELKNRFVKPAMSEALGTKHFQPKKEIVTLCKTWAEGGSGLIVTGNLMVDSHYIAEPGNIVFDEHSDMDILRTWAQAGKTHGAKIIVQMNHPGKQAPKTVVKEPIAPSAVPIDGELGDNGQEDEYGGGIENQIRVIEEMYEEIRAHTPTDFIVGIKINSSDFKEGGIREEDSMRELVADCIGMARPLAIDPQIPNKIKEGAYETLVTGHVSTGIAAIDKKLGSMLGLVYYQLLMQSYAKGKAPHVSTKAWPALFHALRTQGAAALFPQRAR